MKFITITLITHKPDPVTGIAKPTIDRFRPIFDANRAFAAKNGLPVVFDSVEDFIERSSALIGSPEQVIDKVHRYHEQFGHQVIHLHADGDGLTEKQHRETFELFQSDIAPALRRSIPDPPWPDSLL